MAVAADGTRFSPELQFSTAAKADGEIRFFSIDPITVAHPESRVRTVPGLGALLCNMLHYLRHPGYYLLNSATALPCWDLLGATLPRYCHL